MGSIPSSSQRSAMPLFKQRKVGKDEAKKRVERCLVVVSSTFIFKINIFIAKSGTTKSLFSIITSAPQFPFQVFMFACQLVLTITVKHFWL